MPTKKSSSKKKKSGGGGVKVSSQTPVFGSIEDGDMEEFTLCLSETPECIHETNKNGWTPLHQAAYSGELQMLKTLIAKGAELDATDHDGDTAVHYAAVQGELDCVKALAAAGCALETKDNDGETPMHVAHKSVKKELKALVEAAREKAAGGGADDAADAVAALKV